MLSVLSNDPLHKFAEAMQLAHTLYGNRGSVLFVVYDVERNIFDQTFLELELWQGW